MKDAILKVDHFSKTFRSQWAFRPIQAVSDVSFEVIEGECFGFLGQNGAGKTTTIKSILGLIHKTSGQFYFRGQPLKHAEQRTTFGFLPEQPYFYEHLTVFETVQFLGSLHRLSGKGLKQEVHYVLERVGLKDRENAPVRTLSKGLQQRLGFAQAIINKPLFLFLDEPFSGLDPLGRIEMRNLIAELNQGGTTIFLSSHILSDVENICHRAAIMKLGKLRTIVNIQGQDESLGTGSFVVALKNDTAHESLFNSLREQALSVHSRKRLDEEVLAFSFSEYNAAEKAIRSATDAGVRLDSFERESANLEDVFLQIVKD